jgi:hypothetical protein
VSQSDWNVSGRTVTKTGICDFNQFKPVPINRAESILASDGCQLLPLPSWWSLACEGSGYSKLLSFADYSDSFVSGFSGETIAMLVTIFCKTQ